MISMLCQLIVTSLRPTASDDVGALEEPTEDGQVSSSEDEEDRHKEGDGGGARISPLNRISARHEADRRRSLRSRAGRTWSGSLRFCQPHWVPNL